MTDSMTHRGPNDRGTYVAAGVALGVRRLSIVDVEGGHQPFGSEDEQVWAIQNGELYNHDLIRSELSGRGHRFRSRCDTEIIPHLYEQAGDGFPERLRGKFGIAVWDGRNRRAVLARDRLGVKPLYYAHCGDLLVFGSELKAVLASGLVGDELDYEAIDAYLTFGYVPAPHTPLKGVRKLLPGHRLLIENGQARSEPYWRYPKPEPETPLRSKDEYAHELLELLEESVRLRLMSDVPLGAMLSGGLDSSLIVALMARNMGEPVKTFSVGFAEDHQYNELADARYVANVYGTDHHELQLSFTDTINLEQLVWHLDEPVADLSALGFHALSQLASQHVTVALSGQGADELFGGYRKHRAASIVRAWNRLPNARETLASVAANRGPSRVRRAAATLAARDPADRLLAMSSQLDANVRDDLVRGELIALDGRAARRSVLARLDGAGDEPLATTLFLDAQLALPDDMLHYFDRASMAHSLEVRVPFLDHHLVEHAARIPSDLKVRRLTTKYLLKHAARGLVPDRIIDKRKIGFFRGTSKEWLQAKAASAMTTYLLDPDPSYGEMLDRDYVAAMVSRYREDGGVNVQLLLSILMLEVWLSSFLPRARSSSGATRDATVLE